MKVYEIEQGSDQWFCLRATRPTASEFSNLLKLDGTPRDSDGFKTYVATKVAEYWLGGPLPGFQAWDTEQGKILEEEAVPFYELEYREEVQRVGFITNDAGTVGCSPDGLLPGCGLEIKCLQPVHHVKALLAGKFPNEFHAQVHGSLYVTGLPEWKLLLYSRRFPHALWTVKRDEALMEKIDGSIHKFQQAFHAGIEELKARNGGPPDRPEPEQLSGERVRMSWEQQPEEELADVPH